MKPVFVMMVTYKRFDIFKQTIESLVPTLPAGSMLAVYDNNSPGQEYYDYMAVELQEITSRNGIKVQVLIGNENVGWGAAMNEGLELYKEWRDYEYVLESNNDVTYEPDWCERAQAIMEKHPTVGILGLWAHENHGVKTELDDIKIKDDMPAVAWFMRSADLAKFLPFEEKGPTKKRGGIGEDSAFTSKVQALGYLVACPKKDLAHHVDGYDNKGGEDNPAYA